MYRVMDDRDIEKGLDHILYQTGDKDCPEVIQGWNGEVALALCRVCNGAEESLPTHCPGVLMIEDQAQGVVDGVLDCKNGKWCSKS